MQQPMSNTEIITEVPVSTAERLVQHLQLYVKSALVLRTALAEAE
jgi:hypothetical protein